MTRRRKSLWEYPFFGLGEEYKVKLHELIFDLCYYGALDYDAVYSMPVQYRTFYMRRLNHIKEKESRHMESSSNSTEAIPTSKISKGPGISRRG